MACTVAKAAGGIVVMLPPEDVDPNEVQATVVPVEVLSPEPEAPPALPEGDGAESAEPPTAAAPVPSQSEG